jgi:hypothetical protein
MDAPKACTDFYREHVEADAVHEQVVRTDVVGDLVQREAQFSQDVVFGVKARDVVEDRLAAHLMECWTDGAAPCAGRCPDYSSVRRRRRWLVSHSG